MSNKYLNHHGVKGMHWGIRRYQNYDGTLKHPKGRKGSGNSSNKQETEKQKKKGLTDNQKKAIKIGAAVVGTTLLVAGGLYVAKKTGVFAEKVDIAKDYLSPEKLDKMLDIDNPIEAHRYEQLAKKITLPDRLDLDLSSVKNLHTSGKDYKAINNKLLTSINHGVTGMYAVNPARQVNCGHTSISYIMNSLFGYECTATPAHTFNNNGKIQFGKTADFLTSAFKNVERTSFRERWIPPTLNDMSKELKNGTTGILFMNLNGSGHFINYEKSKNGVVTLIDCQNNLKFKPGKGNVIEKAISNARVIEVLDFSNAELKPNAGKILKYLIQ